MIPEHVVIHANQVEWQKQYLPWFMSAFRKYDFDVTHTTADSVNVNKDAIHVVFANNSWKQTVQQAKHLLTVNRCFIGSRFDWVAIGWEGFNGAADFCVPLFGADDKRVKKHGWKIASQGGDPDGYILVCGEYRDMSVWYDHVSRQLKYYGPTKDVRFRPHPFKQKELPCGWRKAPGKAQDDIETALQGARCCITYDSIAGCDAVVAGVPSIAYGARSMARGVSYISYEQYSKAMKKGFYSARSQTIRDCRNDWLNYISYCQWNHEEIKSGQFWEHLRKKYV